MSSVVEPKAEEPKLIASWNRINRLLKPKLIASWSQYYELRLPAPAPSIYHRLEEISSKITILIPLLRSKWVIFRVPYKTIWRRVHLVPVAPVWSGAGAPAAAPAASTRSRALTREVSGFAAPEYERDAFTHGPNLYKDTKPYVCTVCRYSTYSHREGPGGSGGGELTREQVRGAGRKYQDDCLYLQSINSIKHQ